MADDPGSGITTYSFDPHAKCNRFWISKPDGLHPGYFQTSGQDSKSREGRMPTSSIYLHFGDAAACEQCFRNLPD